MKKTSLFMLLLVERPFESFQSGLVKRTKVDGVKIMEKSSGAVRSFHLHDGVFSGGLRSQHGSHHRKDIHKGHRAVHKI